MKKDSKKYKCKSETCEEEFNVPYSYCSMKCFIQDGNEIPEECLVK